jgi:hypothetical protein
MTGWSVNNNDLQMFWKEAALNQRVHCRTHSIPNLPNTTSQSANPDGLLRFRRICLSPETPGFEATFVFTSFLPFVNGTTASRSQRNTTLFFPFLSQRFRSGTCSGIIIIIIIIIIGNTRWCSWLRHWTTSRKVAGSIPDNVTDTILPAALWHWGRLSF